MNFWLLLNIANGVIAKKKENIEPYLDLKGRIDRRVIDEVINETGLTPTQREEKFREIQADYFSNIKAIKTGNYEDAGTFDTEEEKEKRLEDKEKYLSECTKILKKCKNILKSKYIFLSLRY